MIERQPWMNSIEAVLFDLDGTLVETDNHWVAHLAAKLRPLKRILPQLNVDVLARRLVMTLETPANYALSFLEHIGLGSSLFGLTDRLRRSKGVATREDAELVAGTEILLKALGERYKMAVVTTRARREAYAFVELARLKRFFPVIITREDVLRMKPHPEPIFKAAKGLGVSPERCLMVGDTVPDVLAARRAGAYAVAVLSGFGERSELEHAHAHMILNSAVQLLDYLPPSQEDAQEPANAPTVTASL
jgi:phosphoglycolate phosphatase-like HAD superfamily hydrolase